MEHKRIVIVGVSASGKTTLARELATLLQLPVYYLDSIMWRPGWQYVGDEIVVTHIREIISTDQWILEGYISTAARKDVFDRADLIIYLDYPGWLAAWRYIKRWWKHRLHPRPELPGSPETFSFSFLKLVFTKGEIWKLEELFKKHDWESKIVRLTSPVHIQSLVSTIVATEK